MALKFKTSGSADDALAQLMQLAQFSQGRTQRKKDDINTSLKNILDLSRYATNEDSLANITNQWESQKSNASEYEDTNVYYDLIGNVLQDRGAQITQYSNVVDQAQGIVNDADFLRQGSDFENLPEWVKSQVDEEGKPKYESVMQWVSDEYARIETISNTLDSGSKLGFRRGKGIDDTNILTQMNQYKNRLNNTLEALIGDEAITAEEAQLIIAGDRANFIQKRDKKLTEISYGIEEYDEIIQKFDDETIIDKLLEEADIPDLEGFSFGDATKSERDATLKTLITERDKRVDNYKKWSGSDYAAAYKTIGELERQELEGFAGDEVGEFDEEGEFQFGMDKQEKELEEFEKLSLEEQRAEIEKRKKIGQRQYETVGKIEEGIKKGLIDPETKEEFSSGEKLVTGYLKGNISKDELNKTLRDAGLDWNLNLNFMKEGSTKKHINNMMREDIPLLDEWLNIDKSDAGLALNDYLQDDISLLQAANKAHSEDIVGRGGKRKKTSPGRLKSRQINSFKSKFKDSGLSLKEFIKQNEEEYRNIARILKYAYYFKKQHRTFG